MHKFNAFIRKILHTVKICFLKVKKWWNKAWWHKLVIVLISALIIILTAAYSVAVWYRISNSKQPLQIGVTFIADYARALGVDPEKTMDALINEVGVKRFRLVSYWNKIEQTEGKYDFSELDWQFQKTEKSGSEVSLAIGLRQPRWPECHVPDWAKNTPAEVWSPKLNNYITAVVNRYKDSPSLDSWQLENEYILESFGECKDFNTARLQAEFDLIKKLDPNHPIIMTRSNNLPAIITSQPIPDIVGMSVYRRVWDGNLTKRYFTYPLPAWYYASLAGTQKIFTGRNSMLHEMQMEPYAPSGEFLPNVSLEEQDKSFKASDFQSRINYAKRTGMRQIDLWGAEWWYWRKEVKKDPSFWNEAKKAFSNL